MHGAHGPLVQHHQAAARPGRRGELVGEAGHAAVQQAVHAPGRELGRPREGRREGVHAGGEPDLVEGTGADEPAPDQSGRVVAPREAPVEVLGEPPEDALEVGQDPGRHAEPHGGLRSGPRRPGAAE